MNELAKLKKHSYLFKVFQAGTIQILALSISLSFGIAAARLLGSEIYGSYLSTFAWVGLATTLTQLGVPSLLQREISNSRGSNNTESLKALVQAVAIICIVLVASICAAVLLGNITIAVSLLYCLFGNLASVSGSVLIAHEKFLLFAYTNSLFRPAVSLVLLFGLSAIFNHASILPLLAQFAGVASCLLIYLRLLRGYAHKVFAEIIEMANRPRIRFDLVRAAAVFGGTQLLISLTTQLDTLILTYMVSPEMVSFYYAAARGALLLSMIYGQASNMSEPAICRLHAAADTLSAQALATRTANTGVLIAILLVIVSIPLAPLYLAMYGEGFSEALSSFYIVSAGIFLRSLFGPAEAVLRAVNAETVLLQITLGCIIANGLISALLVPSFGLNGAAIGSSVQFAAYGYMCFFAAKKISAYNTMASSTFVLRASREVPTGFDSWAGLAKICQKRFTQGVSQLSSWDEKD